CRWSCPRPRCWRSVRARLPAAHLYRRRSGEGLGFAFAALAYVPVNTVLAFMACFLWDRSTRTESPEGGRVLRWATAAIVAVVLVADAVFAWVAWHGDRCIGPCG
ncbi:MAG: hypothetical protein AAGG08_12190, partial [Actinomycetota bacterium]